MNQCALVDSGKCEWAIVSPSRQTPGIEWAMTEFQKYLGAMGGCKLVIDDPAGGGKQIVIGLRKDLAAGDAALLPPRAEGFDGYAMAVRAGRGTEPARIVIGADNGPGAIYAVYDLLERMGCRWFFPQQDAKDPEVIPRRPTIALDVGAWAVASPFEFRICNASGWFFDIDPKVAVAEMDWAMKNRYNGMGWQSKSQSPIIDQYRALEKAGVFEEMRKRAMYLHGPAHSCDYFLSNDRYCASRPEWFGMRDGKRVPQAFAGAQFCWSNSEARKEFVRNVVEFARETSMLRILCIVPFDGGRACDCPECRRVGASNALMILMGEVIEGVAKVRPELMVETVGGYHPMTEPPTGVEIHPRQRIVWAHWGRYHGCGYDDPEYNNIRNLDTWRRAAKGGITLCQYYTDNFAEPWVMGPFAVALESDRRYMIRNRVSAVYMLMWSPGYWWNHSFNGYMAGRCYYDASLSPYEIIRDYALNYYGPKAGAYLADYFTEWARTPQLAYRVKDDSRDVDRAMLAKERKGCIDPAVAAAKGDPVYAYRVAKVERLHTVAERLTELHRRRGEIRALRKAGKFDEASQRLEEAAPLTDAALNYMRELADLNQGLIDRNEIPGFIRANVKGWLESESTAIEAKDRTVQEASILDSLTEPPPLPSIPGSN